LHSKAVAQMNPKSLFCPFATFLIALSINEPQTQNIDLTLFDETYYFHIQCLCSFPFFEAQTTL
jgi:hypothetical protein